MNSHYTISFVQRTFALLIVSLVAATIILASPIERKLTAVSYSIKNGLPSTQINALKQDSRGYLWIGTNNGLSRYDGSTFKTFSVVDGLPNNWVTAIAEDPTDPGTIVIGTIKGGISLLREDSLRTIISPGSVGALAVDRRGTVWTVLNDTLFRLESGALRFVSTSAIPSNLSDILVRPESGVYVAMGRIVKTLDDNGQETNSLEICTKPQEEIYSFMQDRRGRLWAVTTSQVVVCFSKEKILARYELPHIQPFYCVQDIDGVMWLRTAHGLLAFPENGSPDEEGQFYLIDDEHPRDWVSPVMIDREKSMWIGTWSEGLLKVTDGLTTILSPTNLQWGIHDSLGHLWFGRSGVPVELYLDAHGGWQLHEHKISDVDVTHETIPILFDSSGSLWIAFRRANTPIELRRFVVRSIPGQASRLEEKIRLILPINDFVTMMIDGNHRVWVGLREAGIVVFDMSGREMRRFGTEDGLHPGPVHVLYRDHAGTVWIGTRDEGLRYIDERDVSGGKFRFLTRADGLPDNGIRSMYEDHERTLWIGTRYGGVLALRGNERKIYSMREGLLSNSIWKIDGNEQGVIWLGTDAGLERVDATTSKLLPMLPEFLGYRAERMGIIRDQFVWATTGRGVVTIYNFRNRHPERISPLVQITSYRMNGDDQRRNTTREFSYDRNTCAIEFTGVTFRDESATRYIYRMLGADSMWSKPTSDRTVTFASLRPGEYRFEVHAMNADGLRSNQPATISFVILPPVWQRWWFITSYGFVLLIVAYGAIRYRINKLLEVERLRTRIASDLHDDIGSGLTRIAILSDKLAKQTSVSASLSEDEVRSSRETINNVGAIARELHDSMGDIVWSIDASKDSIGDLLERLKVFAFEMCESENITLSWEPETIEGQRKLSPTSRRSVLLIVKEALTNIVRHANSTSVRISFSQIVNSLHVKIVDNGKGFDPQSLQRVNGLRNMKERAEKSGGSFQIQSAAGRGTTVEVVISI